MKSDRLCSLLSENDWRGLDAALHRMAHVVLERELDPVRIRVSTVPADNAWTVAMLVRVEKWVCGRYETQYHESVQKARNSWLIKV